MSKNKEPIRKEVFRIFARGLAMGSADVIPGVSGGTVALITGIYPRLIRTIKSLHLAHAMALLQLLFFPYLTSRRRAATARLGELDWVFLLSLLSGIGCALAVMVQIIPHVLNHYAYFAYAFFSGLIAVSVTIPLRQMRKAWPEFTVLTAFLALFFFLTGFESNAGGNAHPLAVLLSGALAICVMILPGISGAYILVLLGQYKLIAEAARDIDVYLLAFFSLGLLVGILGFVRILSFFLDRFFSLTMAALTGMMVGSLRGIWPLRFRSVEMGTTQLWVGGISLALAGALSVLILEYLSSKQTDAQNKKPAPSL